MKKLLLLAVFVFFLPLIASAHFSKAERDSINRVSRLDHQLMMEKLGISELRSGPSGNPEAPNAANADKSKIKPYTLPKLLVFENGTEVKTPDDWQKRRKEIVELFNREMYGRVPENMPSVDWEIISEKDTLVGEYPATVKELVGRVDNSS